MYDLSWVKYDLSWAKYVAAWVMYGGDKSYPHPPPLSELKASAAMNAPLI